MLLHWRVGCGGQSTPIRQKQGWKNNRSSWGGLLWAGTSVWSSNLGSSGVRPKLSLSSWGLASSHPKALLCLTRLQHGPFSATRPLLSVHQLVPEMRPEAPGPMFTSAAKHAPREALCVLGSGCPSGASLTAAAVHETSQSHTLL